MLEIIPAILPKDFREIEDKLEQVRGLARFVQIDICDGAFVSSKTWPYTADESIFQAIVDQDRGMPFWEDFEFEFDLMMKNPYEKIQNYISLGAKRLVIHLNSAPKEEIVQIMKDFGKTSDTLAPFDIELGLAIGSRENVDLIEPYINDISFVQVMGIQNIGHQGQGFDEKSIETVEALRHKFPELTITVDGGVSEGTATLLADAGADRLIAGSALFDSDNIVVTMDELRNA